MDCHLVLPSRLPGPFLTLQKCAAGQNLKKHVHVPTAKHDAGTHSHMGWAGCARLGKGWCDAGCGAVWDVLTPSSALVWSALSSGAPRSHMVSPAAQLHTIYLPLELLGQTFPSFEIRSTRSSKHTYVEDSHSN